MAGFEVLTHQSKAREGHQVIEELSPEHVEHYRRDGWVKIPQLLDENAVEVVRSALEGALDDESLRPTAENLGVQGDQATDEYKQVLQVIQNPRERCPELEAIALDLGQVAKDLMGAPAVRLWADRIFRKPSVAEGSRATHWHQDFPKLPFDRRGFLTIWIAINDVPIERGPLTFLPGSHRLGPLGAVQQLEQERPLDFFLDDYDRELVGDPVAMNMAAGDATVHNGLTLHRAGTNRTDEARLAWAVGYFPASALYTGAAQSQSDGLGLKVFSPFDHERFPVVA